MTARRRVLAIGGAAAAALIAAAFAAGPELADGERLRPRAAAALGALAGRELAVSGPLSFSLFPPALRIADARISAGGAAEDELRAAAVALRLAPAPLLAGRVRIAGARLVEPEFRLARGRDGAPNWQLAAWEALVRGGADAAPENVSVARGRAAWRGPNGAEYEIADLDLALERAPGGALRAEGWASWDGLPLAWTAARDGAALHVRIESEGAVATFAGQAPEGGGLSGRAELEADPRALARALAPFPALAPPPDAALAFAARVDWEDGRLAARDAAARLGDSALSGAFSVSAAAPRRFALDLRAARFDLDSWIAEDGWRALAAAVLPADLGGEIAVAVESLRAGGRTLRGAALDAALDGGAFAVRRAAAVLGGGAEAAFAGAAAPGADSWTFDGRIDAAADNLPALLDWAGLAAPEAASVPRRLRLSAAVAGGARKGRADDIALELGAGALAGALAWEFGDRPAFDAALAADRLDLDSWNFWAADMDADRLLDALAGFDARFALEAEAVAAFGAAARGVVLRGALKDGALAIDEARADGAAGARVSVSGALTGLGAEPAIDAAIRARAPDLAAAARAVPALAVLAAVEGPAELHATAVGGRGAVEIDAALSLAGARAALRGVVGDPLGARLHDLEGTLESADPARLWAAFGGPGARAAPPLFSRPLALRAALVGDSGALAFDAEAELAGGRWTASGAFADEGGLTLEAEAAYPDFARLLPLLGGAELDGADTADARRALSGPASGRLALSGAAPAFAFDAAFALSGGALALEGRVDGDSFAVDGALDHPSLAAALAAAGIGGGLARLPGAVALRAAASGDGDGARIDDVSADLASGRGGIRASGSLALDLSGRRPKLTGALAADRLRAAFFLPASGAGADPSRAPLGLSWLRGADAELDVSAASLDLAGLPLEDARAALVLRDGALEAAPLAGRLFGGAVEARLRLSAGAAPELDGEIAVSGARLAPALERLAGIRSVRGPVDFGMRFATAGATAQRMVLALEGDGEFRAADGRIAGFDLASAAAAIAAARESGAPPDLSALGEGETAYETLSGSFSVAGGRLRAGGVRLAAGAAEARVSVEANLAARRHRAAAELRFAAYPDLPPVILRREGPLDSPRRRADFGEFSAALGAAAARAE